jgi:uncharacterized membrane protein
VVESGRPVFVDEGGACDRRHRLDGGHALSAAAVRLSLRGGAGLAAVRDLQGDGTAFLASGWMHAKLLLVLAMSGMHGFLSRWVRAFAADRNLHSQKFYRFINEVPTILMIGIVILVIVKPF